MRRSTVLGIAVSLAASLLAASVGRAAVGIGDSPTFDLVALDGQPLSLAQFKGKLVLVDFWATWCIPCVEQADHMVAVRKKYGDRGLQIIGVTLDKSASKLKSTIAEKGFDWPQYYDPKAKRNHLAEDWGVDGIPRTFLFDPSGKVVWTGNPANMDAAIEQAFKQTPPTVIDPAILAKSRDALAFVADNADADPLAAMKRLAEVPAEAMKDPMLADKITAARAKLLSAGDQLVAGCESLVTAGDYAGAIAQLKSIADAIPHTKLADTAKKRADEIGKMPEAIAQARSAQRSAKAAELLTTAQTFQTQKKDAQAYAAFKAVVKQFPETDAAKVAGEAIAAYEKDPAFTKHADVAADDDGKAQAMLGLAASYRSAGKLDAARAKYGEVIAQYPKTKYAAQAEAELAAMVKS